VPLGTKRLALAQEVGDVFLDDCLLDRFHRSSLSLRVISGCTAC
jgi:hypothetical protein